MQALARAALLTLLTTLGCSVLTAPPSDIRCEPGAMCPLGMTCMDGTCQDCADAFEICDGRDNDCDGLVDEPEDFPMNEERCDGIDDDCDGLPDEDFDADGDGFTTCGCINTVDDPCVSGPADCNDEDPNIHPDLPDNPLDDVDEQCDSIDHDCDGSAGPPVGEDGGCTDGQVCVSELYCALPGDCRSRDYPCDMGFACDSSTTPARCVDSGCPVEGCPGGTFCNAVDCEPLRGAGDACGDDIQCSSGICSPMEAFGFAPVPPGGVCVQPCCSDTDCPGEQFCWAAPAGARTCLPVDAQSSVTGRTALGAGTPFSTCSTGSDCRSGRCEMVGAESYCIAPCRRTGDCPDSMACVVGSIGGSLETLCAPGDFRDQGRDCDSDDQCAAGRCEFGTCTSEACATNGDCGIDNPFGSDLYDRCGLFVADGELIARCSDGDSTLEPCCINAHCPGGTCRPGTAMLSGDVYYPMLCSM